MGKSGALVLFDIDGTLIRRAGPGHRESLEEALWRVARVKATTDGIPVQGMLDGDILTCMMREAGAGPAEIRRLMPEVMQRAMAIYVRRCPNLQRKVCPGVRPALRKLGKLGAVMGLVTGNLSRIGWKKMERAGLKQHFRFGAFAESAATRAALAKLAIAEARRMGWIGRGAAITLVGDHPNDIRAAHSNGIRVVSVATGLVGMDELRLHSPDMLVTDLRELDPALLLKA
jgi:phosphoglycolate phosphatase